VQSTTVRSAPRSVIDLTGSPAQISPLPKRHDPPNVWTVPNHQRIDKRLSTILTTALLFAVPALAQTAVIPETPPSIVHPAGTIDMTAAILDLSNKPIADGTVPVPKGVPVADFVPPPLTRGRVIALVMCADRPNGEDRTELALPKAIRCNKGMAIMDDKAAVLTAPLVSLIEDHLVAWPSGVVIRAIVKAIDPAQDLSK
jgi:hypothetical protein